MARPAQVRNGADGTDDRRRSWPLSALVPLIGFVYVLQRPISHGEILLPVLALMAAFGFVAFAFNRANRMPRPLVLLLWIELTFGVLFLLVGSGNPGVYDQALTYIGFPVVYWLMVAGITEKLLRPIFTTLLVGSLLAALTIILFIGNQQGVLPEVIPNSLLVDQSGAFYNETATLGVGIHLYALEAMVTAAPLWVASVVVPTPKWFPSAGWRLAAAVLCATAAVVAGRRAIVVTVVLAPLLAWFFGRLIGRGNADQQVTTFEQRRASSIRRWALSAAAVLGVVVVGRTAFAGSTLSLRTIGDAFGEIAPSFFGQNSSSADAVTRSEESRILLGQWHDSPILGHGFGAVVPGYARNFDKPWDFELQYHLLLFATGIVGAGFALAALVVFFRAARAAVRQRPELAGTLNVTLVGMAAILLAAASNPYFQAPGYYWGLFLPVALIKVMLSAPAGQADGSARSGSRRPAAASTDAAPRTPGSSGPG